MKKNKSQLKYRSLEITRERGPGFEVPEDYFESFEENVMAVIGLTEVTSQERLSPFQTPKGYFSSVEKSVNDQIHPPKQNRAVIKMVTWLSPVAVAASLLLIFVLNVQPKTLNFEALATSEIESTLDNGTLAVDYTTLLSLVDEMEIDLENLYADVSDQDLETYLTLEEMESLIDEYY